MRFQERARSLGVRRRETLPWPPRSRMRGDIVQVVVGLIDDTSE